ncbi:secretory carrier-associated membrane protein 3 [Lactuca sativa]|uniref:secretory carrier-associated membrane protein 3 n=1 Tax=Lactuca sativa TaxID=4236 RepID=UPI000CD8DEC7|nr:secretory carrier-associated membrane protein 3 [Lactuca sativa]
MASHRDQNPFIHDDDINPFAKLKKKRQELEAKEAELNKREEILRRKEETLAKPGAVIRPKNWPSCYPLVHHDIANDIPLHLQRIQYVAYAILLGVPISLFWNVLLSIAVFARGAAGVFVFFSIIYFFLGPMGAFYFWYRPLYRAFRTNNGTSFGCFFFNFFNHIVFFSFAAIGPRIIFVGLQFAGLLNAMSLISDYPALGIMSFIGFGFFAIEVLLSIWVFRQVYMHFRGSGGKATTVSIDL